MKIWRFTDPDDDRFASAGRRGSWTDPHPDGVCPECTASRQERMQPLIIAWEPGSDVVGDFVWPGFDDDVVVTDEVLETLRSRFTGFEPGPVEMIDEPVEPAHGKPRVTLPYSGPALHEIWPTTWVDADLRRSTIGLERRCSTCGTEFWYVAGVEEWDDTYDPERAELEVVRLERAPNAGIYVVRKDLDGADIFRVHQCPGWLLCSDAVRDAILEAKFSNVDFLETGEVI